MRWCYDNKKWAFLSDLVRLLVVYQNGGIYFDTDVEVIKTPNDMLICNAFYGFENNENICTGMGFGAEAKNKTVYSMINEYIKLVPDKEGNFPIIKCPELNTKALLPYGLKLNGKYQKLDGAEVFPYDYFNPYDDPTGKLNKTENTVSIHWYSKSWMDKKTILRSKITKPFHRIFGVDCFKRLKK